MNNKYQDEVLQLLLPPPILSLVLAIITIYTTITATTIALSPPDTATTHILAPRLPFKTYITKHYWQTQT